MSVSAPAGVTASPEVKRRGGILFVCFCVLAIFALFCSVIFCCIVLLVNGSCFVLVVCFAYLLFVVCLCFSRLCIEAISCRAFDGYERITTPRFDYRQVRNTKQNKTQKQRHKQKHKQKQEQKQTQIKLSRLLLLRSQSHTTMTHITHSRIVTDLFSWCLCCLILFGCLFCCLVCLLLAYVVCCVRIILDPETPEGRTIQKFNSNFNIYDKNHSTGFVFFCYLLFCFISHFVCVVLVFVSFVRKAAKKFLSG